MNTSANKILANDMLIPAQEWCESGRSVVLATVVATWGSSPRPVGSQLLVDGEGHFLGSVSGGCVETTVIEEAQLVLQDGKSRMLEFSVSNERAWEVGLACGGRILVYVEAVQ